MQYRSTSPARTQKIAVDLIKKLLQQRQSKQALVLALEGELGAGKTTFVKGLAKVLKIKQPITSPTFVILKTYPLQPKTHNHFKSLYHIDAYRLKDQRDLIALGIKEIISDPTNLVLIEWSDRVKKILPKKFIKIHFDHLTDSARLITVS